MKKTCILLAVLLLVSFAGCANSEANQLVDDTLAAIENGEYEDALRYGESAIEKGNENEEFQKIVSLLKQYMKVIEWLEDGRVVMAEEAYEEITDYEDTVMKSAVEALEDDIEDKKEKIKDDIETLRESVDEERYYTAANQAKELLGMDLTDEQKDEVMDLLTKAYRGQKEDEDTPTPTPTSTPSPTPDPTPTLGKMLTEREAIIIASNALDIPLKSTVTAQYCEEGYYQVLVTIEGADYTDEKGCKVDAYTGEVYDLVG